MSATAAIYMRVSTEEQAKDGYGLDAQHTKCAAMATVKGWEVATVFQDDGISGTKDERERAGLAGLLAAAKAREVNAVIVGGLDRLGRSSRLILRLVDDLAAAGVEIVSCKEAIDTSTPTGQFMLTIFAAMAQLDRDQIVERTTGGRNERGRRDGERGGRVPFGYVRREALEVDTAAAEVVRRIFAMRAGGQKLTTIADELNAAGIVSPRGAAWHASSVHYILKSETAYRGGRRGESNVTWPAILA